MIPVTIKERPILYTPENVRKILDGMKTQTRRVVKPQPYVNDSLGGRLIGHRNLGGEFAEDIFGVCAAKLIKCPYGQPEDQLWVREAWSPVGDTHRRDHPGFHVRYKADKAQAVGAYGCTRWYPSIHMPRWACRLVLEITAVRVERLQGISNDDAIAEGCNPDHDDHLTHHVACAVEAYERLWDSINGKTHPWKSNPWVWAITFKRVDA